MTGTIQKSDNSLTMRIPLAVAKQIHVQEGDPVVLKVGASCLTVKAVPKRLKLDDLLEKVTHENLRRATDWAADVGREVCPI
jgi:antitoxin component of MazEF toxin-antitoxin module